MGSKLGTYSFSSESRQVNSDSNVNYLSIGCTSGSIDVTMVGKTVVGWGNNNAITLSSGQSTSVQDTVNIQPLDGVTIDATSGTAIVIVG